MAVPCQPQTPGVNALLISFLLDWHQPTAVIHGLHYQLESTYDSRAISVRPTHRIKRSDAEIWFTRYNYCHVTIAPLTAEIRVTSCNYCLDP